MNRSSYMAVRKGDKHMNRIIAVDAGHYYDTPGRRCLKELDASETREWELNSRVAGHLENILSEYDCTVLRVDDPDGKRETLINERIRTANRANADFYISIHHDLGIGGKKGGGTVVCYAGRSAERQRQAQALYDEITSRTGLIGNRYEKTLLKTYYVIYRTKMPALLVENGFMDSSTDVPIITTPGHAKNTADGIAAFLIDTLKLCHKRGCCFP